MQKWTCVKKCNSNISISYDVISDFEDILNSDQKMLSHCKTCSVCIL